MLTELLGWRTPGREGRATIENPSVSLSDPASFDEAFGGGSATDAGIKITERKSLACAALWQGIAKISGDIAKLPFDLWRRRPDEGREKAKNHRVYSLVRRRPNREHAAVVFWRRMVANAVLWNRSFAYIDRAGDGTPLELFPLLPDRTTVERHNGEIIYVTEVNKRLRPFPARDILHIEGLCFDNLGAQSMIYEARNSIALALAQERFASKFFRNGGRTGGVLELPIAMPKKARDTVEEGFRKTYENVDEAFKTVILRENAKFHAAQSTPKDAQMTEARESQVRDVARWLNMAPSLLGVEGSRPYKSKEEDKGEYLDSTLSIWLELISGECWLKLLTPAEQDSDELYFEHNTGALLRMATKDRYAVHEIAIRSRIKNPNEVRLEENMLPYEGGDEFLASPGTDLQQGGEEPEEDDDEPKPKPKGDDERQLALRRVVFNLGARARHKAQSPDAYIAWVDGGLQSHRDEYRRYVGDEEGEVELFGALLSDLRTAAETATAATLPGAVHTIIEKIERSV
jgi:HK97 family phage portal protein